MGRGRTRSVGVRIVLLVAIPCIAASCVTWSTRPASPGEYPRERARVLLRDGSRVEIRNFTVRSDSIIGERHEQDSTARVAIAIGDVERLERSEISFARTTAMAAIVSFLALVVGTAVSLGIFGGSGY